VQTKLTLRLEHELIERAKAYSRRTGKSLSRLVADYFSLLEPRNRASADSLPPKTRSLLGVLAGSELDEQDYRDHLAKKYG
jgi:hypothetical protein